MGAWKDAVQCRNRAEMLKNVADNSEDEIFRIAALNVARHYETMASSLELELRAKAIATAA